MIKIESKSPMQQHHVLIDTYVHLQKAGGGGRGAITIAKNHTMVCKSQDSYTIVTCTLVF